MQKWRPDFTSLSMPKPIRQVLQPLSCPSPQVIEIWMLEYPVQAVSDLLLNDLLSVGLSDHGHELLPGERDQPAQDRVQPEPGEGSLHGNCGGHLPGGSRGRIHGRINQVTDILIKNLISIPIFKFCLRLYNGKLWKCQKNRYNIKTKYPQFFPTVSKFA